MILPKYEFLEPDTISEATTLLHKGTGQARIIAGGTDLLVNMKKNLVKPASLVSLSRLKELDNIKFDDRTGLNIGSMVTVAALTESEIIRDNFPALYTAAGKLGSLQIRNRATIGGNICSARPAADLIGPLIAYGATAIFSNGKKERRELLENIFQGPGVIEKSNDEILTDIRINTPKPQTGASYIKYGIRKAMEISVVNVTAVLAFKDMVCTSAKIVLGAVAPTFLRCKLSEDLLTGKKITEELAMQAARLATDSCCPISDNRASADYRTHLVKVLTTRSIMEAASAVTNKK